MPYGWLWITIVIVWAIIASAESWKIQAENDAIQIDIWAEAPRLKK